MTRRAKRRALSSLAVLFGAATIYVVGCAGEIIPPPPQCTGSGCSCDEDPLQPLCKAFNERPDGQVDMMDATKIDTGVGPDTSMPQPDAAIDAPDEASDANDDGG